MRFQSMKILIHSWMLWMTVAIVVDLLSSNGLGIFVSATAIPWTEWILKTKCYNGNDKPQLWKYEGYLYDPLNGKKIARVEGLELVQQRTRRQPMNPSSIDSESKNSTATATATAESFPNDSIMIDSILQDPNSTYDDAITLWSQKVFLYSTAKKKKSETTPVASDGITINNDNDQEETPQREVLKEIRIRPNSPRKIIPLNQAVSLFETATTYISRDRDDDELLVHSEWPNGDILWGTASIGRKMGSSTTSQRNGQSSSNVGLSETPSTLDYTVYTKPRSKRSPMYIFDLSKRSKKDKDGGDSSVVISPERSALIQFGTSHMEEAKHKFGARETYSWTLPVVPVGGSSTTVSTGWVQSMKARFLPLFSKQSVTSSSSSSSSHKPSLSYTRYGEGPPFYAPNRMCMLELQGTPIDSINEATSVVRELFQSQTIQGWGQERKQSLLELIMPEPKTWRERKQRQAQKLWERLRDSSKVDSSGSFSN